MTDLNQLRRAAEELARSRKERPTTGHLLVALTDSEGPERTLLSERRLGKDVLLQAARIAQDDDAAKLPEALTRAREFAGRTPPATQSPGGLHVLFALCQEPKSAAYRILAQLGVDIGKLRTQSMQIALGVLAPPRAPVPAAVPVAKAVQNPTVAVPLRPPVRPLTAPIAAAAVQIAKLAAPRPQEPAAAPKSKNRRREPRGKASSLARLATSWSDQIRAGALTRPLGRNKETLRALDALAKLEGNNPCFAGGPGVGKSKTALAVAFELAAMQVEVWHVSATQLANRVSRAELPGKLLALEEELASMASDERMVLVLDDLPAFFAPEAGDEIAAFARRVLERHEIPCLATGETAALRSLEGREPAAYRVLSTIELDEMSHAETLSILEGRKASLEEHHGVSLPTDVLERAVTMAARYLPKGALAERALSVVDLAAARAKRTTEAILSARTVASVVSELSLVPEDRVLETDQARMLKLESLVAERLVGHDDAVSRISRVLRRNATGMCGSRPIGVFLLLGPTGVGKTETAKAVAECMFHSEHAMTRLDLSEYAEPHAVARLVGAPPGYIGHEAGGQLTSAVRKRPHQVILLDEIEKAHRDVLEAFLAVFDEGIMTDGRGVTVSFENTVIFLTSNLGAEAGAQKSDARIGFGQRAAAADTGYSSRVLEAARAGLPPELWNRFDDVLVFPALSRDAVRDITRKMVGKLAERMRARQRIELSITDAAVDWVLDEGGFDPRYGARPVRRTLARLVEAELAERVLRGEIVAGDRICIDCSSHGLTFGKERTGAVVYA